jgi:hypothetical protein
MRPDLTCRIPHLGPAGLPLDQVLPAVQQIVTAAMSPLGEQTLHTLLDTLTAANAALDAAPHDLSPPAARRAPPHLRRT